MIVTCPDCQAKYRIKQSSIQGRGAKITCLNSDCRRRFVVYKQEESANDVSNDVDTFDFRTLGLTWKVRKGIGVTYNFHDLRTLNEFIREGQVDRWDTVSYTHLTLPTILLV